MKYVVNLYNTEGNFDKNILVDSPSIGRAIGDAIETLTRDELAMFATDEGLIEILTAIEVSS